MSKLVHEWQETLQIMMQAHRSRVSSNLTRLAREKEVLSRALSECSLKLENGTSGDFAPAMCQEKLLEV